MKSECLDVWVTAMLNHRGCCTYRLHKGDQIGLAAARWASAVQWRLALNFVPFCLFFFLFLPSTDTNGLLCFPFIPVPYSVATPALGCVHSGLLLNY